MISVTPFAEPLRLVVFDIETRLSPEAVGGWDAVREGRAGISALVAYNAETNEHLFYDDFTLEGFVELVEREGVVLAGYNTEGFDIPVVEAILGRRIGVKYRVDLYAYIKEALDREHRTRKRGWKLGDVAGRTMGLSKSGSGALAPDLAAQGRFAELYTYCQADVDLTRQLLDYARRHGGVVDDAGHLLDLQLPAWFRLPPEAPLEA